MSINPVDPSLRGEWLRWQVSDELDASIAPGLRKNTAGAVCLLKEWLQWDSERLISHLHGAVNVHARFAGIPAFTREEIAHEVGLVAWCHRVTLGNAKR